MRKFIGRRDVGAGLVEVLIGILIVVIAAIGTLSYFSYGLGGIGREGNRRAAMERARERMEELLAANVDQIAGTNLLDGNIYWLICAGPPCTWNRFAAAITEGVAVNDLLNQVMETRVQLMDDPPSNTSLLDAVELSVKVWYTGNFGADDDNNRVYLKTLRALI